MPEWERVPLGEVVKHRKEFITIDDLTQYKRCRVQVRAQGIVLRDEVPGSAIKTKKQQVCRAGEFLVAEIDAKMGGFGIVPPELEGAVVSSHYFLFEIDETKLDRDFLDLYSKTPEFMEQVSAQGSTNYAAIRPSHVLAYTMPLPPLPEQQRIVARVKGLLAKVEEATRLREGVNGELRKLLNSTIDEFLDGYEETSQPLTELLREGTQNGLSAKPNEDASGIPILRISAATSRKDAYVDESDAKFLRLTDNELQKFQLEEGDLLACRFNGNLHYVGRFALYRAESGQVQVYPDKLIRFRVNREVLLPEYARLALNSTRAREQIEVFCATTAGNIGISAGNLKTISIPVPPVEKQIDFITRVEGLSRHINSAGAFQDQTSTELQALPSAILAQAFAGAL